MAVEGNRDGYVVVDTDVFIWLNRGTREKAAEYTPYVEGKRVVLSFATVAELWRGAYAQGYNDESRMKLRAAIEACVVVTPNEDLTQEWAKLTNEARAMSPGHPLGQNAQTHDAWVAATARHYGVPLLTDNVRHFEGLAGLELLAVA